MLFIFLWCVHNHTGSYVPGVTGVTAATLSDSSVVSVSLGSGDYSLQLSGADGHRICAMTREGSDHTLTCPSGSVLTQVSFASFGLNRASCTT
jgi:hypothetical protein